MCDYVSDGFQRREKQRETMGESAGGGVMKTSDEEDRRVRAGLSKPATPTILLRGVTSEIKLTKC